MAKGNYVNRRSEGPKLGQIVAKDLKKSASIYRSKPALKRESTTLELSLQGKNLTDEGLRAVAAGLEEALRLEDGSSSHRLIELNLSNNSLTIESLAALSTVISLAAYDIRDLDLSHNNIRVTTKGEATKWEEFLNSFRYCRVLRRIDLSDSDLSGSVAFEVLTRVYFKHSPVDPTDLESPEDWYITTELPVDDNVSPSTKRKQLLDLSKLSISKADEHSIATLSAGTVLKRRCGLRSVPYIILSHTNMDDAGALHLSYILSQHYFPQQLMSPLYTRSTCQVLEERYSSAHCWGLVYLPNDKMTWAAKALEQSEMVREQLLGISNEGDSVSINNSYVLVAATQSGGGLQRKTSSTSSVLRRRRNSTLSVDSGLSYQSPASKKDPLTQLESSRRKLQRETIERQGPCSMQLWRAALNMLRISRAVFAGSVDPNAPSAQTRKQHECMTVLSTANASSEGTDAATSNYHNDACVLQESCKVCRPGPPMTKVSHNRHVVETPPSPLRPTPVSFLQSHELGELPYRDSKLPAGLLEDCWLRIIAHAAGATGVLSLRQQRAVVEHAKNRNRLAQERDRLSMNESAQVWHLLETLGCLTYDMRV